ncbi:MAG: GTP-binding protein, partial [Candidatus Riflebacteria bacterium]|nr:GTP-binding protein [Candidatus Riflebacteria bacterium]
MSLTNTPAAERLHIGIFGRINAGKSSVINAITGQNIAIVSDVKGTTTDPVYKTMELLPLGPVMIIDTPGLDDEGQLGKLRVQRSYQVLNKTDIAVLVVDGVIGIAEEDNKILNRIKEKNIPYIVVFNRADLVKCKP